MDRAGAAPGPSESRPAAAGSGPCSWPPALAGRTRVSVRLEGMERSLERVRGIEPPSSAWEAEVLPLNNTRRCPSILGPGNAAPAKPRSIRPPGAGLVQGSRPVDSPFRRIDGNLPPTSVAVVAGCTGICRMSVRRLQPRRSTPRMSRGILRAVRVKGGVRELPGVPGL